MQNETINTIEQLVEKLKEMPADQLSNCWEEAVKLSSYLVSLGMIYAEVEKDYCRLLAQVRKHSKSSAEAEIEAQASEEYYRMRRVRWLREDVIEVLRVMKRIFSQADKDKELQY